ncbi:hypothetical protein ACROYT_G011552 [Oculina patagonica]
MAAVASNFAPTVTVKVYKNGNRNFLGKTIVINRRHIRTMEALYDEVTSHIASFNAVRRICTPIGGRPVQSLENIRNKSVYVAAGREMFKKLNYADLGVSKPRPPRKTDNSPKKAVTVTEGRHKMDYEWGKRDLKIIHVFCNGDVFKPSVKIVLQKRLQQSMEQILDIVQEHVFVAATVAALYTIDGKPVLTPAQLVTGKSYVAVERGKFFKRANYGGAALSLSRSPRAPFLPQIGNGQLTNKEGGLPKKNIAKRKPRVAKANTENKTGEYSPRDQARDQSRVTTESFESPRDVVSNLSPDPPAVTSLLRASQDNFTISASPPGQLEDDTPVQEYATPIAEDDKDDSLTGGDVFKASGLLQEKADEIKDTRQTKEEKPLDLLPAEEVLEEVLEQVEDARKTSGHEDQDGSKAVEEIEDDVETIEDDPKLNEAANKIDKSQVRAWQHDETESAAAVDNSKEVDHSRLSPEEKHEEPSASPKIDDDNSAGEVAPSEQDDKKDDESGRVSSSRGKAASPAAKEEDRNTPPSSEPEKSEDEDDSEDSEEDEDEDEEEKKAAKNDSDNQASDSNNNDKNSAPDKGSSETQNTDKTSYIS